MVATTQETITKAMNLSDTEALLVIANFLQTRGAPGGTEEELHRMVEIAAELKFSATIWNLILRGEIAVDLQDQELAFAPEKRQSLAGMLSEILRQGRSRE